MKNSGNMNELLLSKYLRDIAKDMEGGGGICSGQTPLGQAPGTTIIDMQ